MRSPNQSSSPLFRNLSPPVTHSDPVTTQRRMSLQNCSASALLGTWLYISSGVSALHHGVIHHSSLGLYRVAVAGSSASCG